MNYKSLALLALIVILFSGCSRPTEPGRSGLELVWKRPIEGRVLSQITKQDNYLYFADASKNLYKYNVNGNLIRTRKLDSPPSLGKIQINENSIFVGCGNLGTDTYVYAFNKSTFGLIWSNQDYNWMPVISIDESNLYCVDLHKVYAYEIDSGNLAWSKDIFGHTAYNPVIHEDKLIFATGGQFKQDGYLYCLTKQDGQTVFQDTLPYISSNGQLGGSLSGVCIWDDFIYVASDNRYLYCFNRVSGNLVWKFLADAPMETTPSVIDGVLYTGSLNRTCYAIDALTGEKKWSYQTDASIYFIPPQFYQHLVLFVTYGSMIYFNKNTGSKIFEVRSSTGNISISTVLWDSNGKIYATGFDDTITPAYVNRISHAA